MKSISIKYEIGFSDSTLLSYYVKDNNIILFLECWNAVILELKFENFAALSAMNYFDLSDVQEFFESPLLEKVLSEFYDEKPNEHPYRIFKLISTDDLTALEIVCENFYINKKSTPSGCD